VNHSVNHCNSQTPANIAPTGPAPSPLPTVVGSLPIGSGSRRDFQNFVRLVSRTAASAQYDDQENSASALGKSIASLVHGTSGITPQPTATTPSGSSTSEST
jgi:hypothetical protein